MSSMEGLSSPTAENGAAAAIDTWNGIQYSTTGQPLFPVFYRSKQCFIAYALDSGGRNQLLLYQFEDFSGDPFSRKQPLIIDGKPAGEDSVIGLLNGRFNSNNIGVQMFEPDNEGHETKKNLRAMYQQLVIKNLVIVKGGLEHLTPAFHGESFLIEINANGVVLKILGKELQLEKVVSWVGRKT